MIKVLDENNNYVKFAKLKDVMPYLSKMNIKFNNAGPVTIILDDEIF